MKCTFKTIYAIIFLLFYNILSSQEVNITSCNTTSAIWPKQNLIDKNNNSIWSSVVRQNSLDKENASIFFLKQKVNYVKLLPRYVNNLACAFPKSFTIKYYNGSTWIATRSEVNFPKTARNEYIILPIKNTGEVNYIMIESDELNKDDVGNNVFQLAEFTAGYNREFDMNFAFIGKNTSTNSNDIRNVGADSFNPNKLKVWHFDTRGALITAKNIYAPTIVNNGATNWNVYFGGWDFANSNNDNIYMTNSQDDFLSFKEKALVISNVPYVHANNGSAIKDGSGFKMLYTAYPYNNKNKTFYATSNNGLNWNFNNPINMSGYPNWPNADVNGGNTLIKENGVYHIYFNDFAVPSFKVYHATSTDFVNFTYQGIAQNRTRVPNDVKAFTFGNTKHYLMGTHLNSNTLEFTLSNDLNSFPSVPTFTLGTSNVAEDKLITSIGFVSKNNRLLGYLYGSSSDRDLDKKDGADLTDNKIYANWLQKKVIFKNNFVQWGDIEQAYGPDIVRMFMNTQIETGNFYVYDSDGATLLYKSPLVTMKAGDIWDFISYNTTSNTSKVAENINNKIDFEGTKNVYNEVKNITFFPNPAKDNITFSDFVNKVTVLDMYGKTINDIIINGTYMDTSNFKKGIYYLKIDSNKTEQNLKLIIE